MEIKTIKSNEQTLLNAANSTTNANSYIVMSEEFSQKLKRPIKDRSNLVLVKKKPYFKDALNNSFRYFDNSEELRFWLYNQEIAFPKIKQKIFKFEGDVVTL